MPDWRTCKSLELSAAVESAAISGFHASLPRQRPAREEIWRMAAAGEAAAGWFSLGLATASSSKVSACFCGSKRSSPARFCEANNGAASGGAERRSAKRGQTPRALAIPIRSPAQRTPETRAATELLTELLAGRWTGPPDEALSPADWLEITSEPGPRCP